MNLLDAGEKRMKNEDQNIEYKQSWRDEYLKWICGFANADGGRMLIGVSDEAPRQAFFASVQSDDCELRLSDRDDRNLGARNPQGVRRMQEVRMPAACV